MTLTTDRLDSRRTRPNEKTSGATLLQSPSVVVPLKSLPVAAAGMQQDGTVAHANDGFCRLFRCDPVLLSERLPDLVLDPHRQAIVDSLRRLSIGDQGHVSLRLRPLRAESLRTWLTVEICRLESTDTVPYVVYARPSMASKRSSVAGARASANESSHVPAAASVASLAGSRHAGSWPPLLSMLSHELRGSLNAIRGWAAVAENGSLPPDRIPRAFRVIRQNAESLTGLVDMLFDLSRNASGSLRLKLEAVDLNQLAAGVADSTDPAAQRHQVSLRIDCARTPLVVTGDRIRLEQVIRNLLENAIKFTPAGGSVTLRTSRHAADAELSVHDTGAGISREQLPVIFDPFRQGLAPVASADVGLGLGLALARELVHLHHGEIRASSLGVGCGSTFTVTLPLASSARRRPTSGESA